MFSREVISAGELTIELTRKSTIKNLYIRVIPPEGRVTVSAPLSLNVEEVKALVLQRMPEILNARRKIQGQPRQTRREYVSGETCYLWGNRYMLRVVYNGRCGKVEVFPGIIVLAMPGGKKGASIEGRHRVLTEWYRAELKRVLPRLIEECCERVGVSITDWNVRNMRTRWGSCNVRRKTILLNLQLIKKPFECLEYVVIHELVHLLERKHNHRFRSLVEKFCPNWKSSRELLNSMPLDYIEDR